MPENLADILAPERALIFRITHRDNVPHILVSGVHCRNSETVHASYVEIGNPEIIDRRKSRVVPVPPRGVLADYVPFYFTPCTPMLYNIVTGHNGVQRRPRSEIVVLVSSLDRLEAASIPYVIADRNAALVQAEFGSGRSILDSLPWDAWRARDFKRDPDRPDMFERYQAEALVHRLLPVENLLCIATHDQSAKAMVESAVTRAGSAIKVVTQSTWYL